MGVVVKSKGNKPQRGFYYVQGGREMFVPRRHITRFFREWTFPTRIDDIRKMRFYVEQYVGTYDPKKDKIAFVRDANDYLNLFLAPISQKLVEVDDFLSAMTITYDADITPADWDKVTGEI